MSVAKIKETSIWKKAFGHDNCKKHEEKCALLELEFFKFRDRVEILVGKIANTLPALTQHDISHLDALWEVAGVITGDNYPINPLEAFVLGGAILLHDSALCWDAYDGGQAGVRATIEWKDAYAVECDRDPKGDDSILKANADFSALRALHAH